ncbi:hypothetical protein OG21DRAFT_1173484 [Imleria badia]|nr:hypothetical protein OG21DRAFT_1173484 [Imleria badia]
MFRSACRGKCSQLRRLISGQRIHTPAQFANTYLPKEAFRAGSFGKPCLQRTTSGSMKPSSAQRKLRSTAISWGEALYLFICVHAEIFKKAMAHPHPRQQPTFINPSVSGLSFRPIDAWLDISRHPSDSRAHLPTSSGPSTVHSVSWTSLEMHISFLTPTS